MKEIKKSLKEVLSPCHYFNGVLCPMWGMDVIMNKEFVKKMIKAEKLRYEAIKEILPNNLREKVDEFEKNAFNLLKDVALEMIKEDVSEESHTDNKTTKKVNVDFS